MNIKNWFKLQPEDDGSGRGRPLPMPRNEKRLLCVYCAAFTIISVEEKGPVVVCVTHPTHREPLY